MKSARSSVAVLTGAGIIVLSFFSASALADEKAKMSLSATVSTELQQDQIQLVFSARSESNSAAQANEQIINALQGARQALGQPLGVDISSGTIQTFPVYGQKGEPTTWRGRADLVLSSRDILAASQAADRLTGELALSRVDFSLSDQARRQEQSRLIDRVAESFRHKADVTARAFGYVRYDIVSLEVVESGEMINARPLMMSRMATADTTAPPALDLQPGKESVSVTVSGWVQLRY